MKKVVFVLCFYSAQVFSQGNIGSTYLIQGDPEIYFFQAPSNSFHRESVCLIKSDYKSEEMSIAKTGKVDPPMASNPFPDPFSSSININIPGNLICNFSVSDITGEVVFKTQIYGEKGRFDLAFLPDGIYLASISAK
jgi:hypothetical protein